METNEKIRVYRESDYEDADVGGPWQERRWVTVKATNIEYDFFEDELPEGETAYEVIARLPKEIVVECDVSADEVKDFGAIWCAVKYAIENQAPGCGAECVYDFDFEILSVK